MYARKKNPPKDIIPPVDIIFWASQVVQWVKNLPAIFGRSPGEGIGYPLLYSGLENPMDREAQQATVHGVAKS